MFGMYPFSEIAFSALLSNSVALTGVFAAGQTGTVTAVNWQVIDVSQTVSWQTINSSQT